ncbi:MAG: carboxypeptidase regulatory-like domain-containing protein [Bacteroidales bacterium]|nr:carboxypeptidase regulatory-like domain-containing protein [Bacteroidales bacterium]
MKLLRFVCLFCAAILGGTTMAQSQRELQQLMRDRGEYYFTLSVDDPAQIHELSRICSVDGTDGRNVVAYANQQEYDKLIALGFQPELQTPPCMLHDAVMWDGSNRSSYAWDSYPTYDAYQNMMEAFPEQALSDRSCTLLDLGTLNSGRKILGVRLNNGQPNGKPKFLYSSTMHGDEVTGMMLMLRLIDEFCTSNDPRIVNLLNNIDLFIFPLTNPDGTYYGGNNTMNQARRYNNNGVDLNRNYKDYHRGDHPDGNSYALETQWTMQLADEYLFTMSANYHGGAEVANYPWDAIDDRHPDDAWYQYICLDYVSRARAVSSSYMKDPFSNGITNGADWYVITGSRQDYENAYGQCREITMECSSTKKPNASTMPTYWNYNHNAMLGLLEQCLNGVHGVVRDADTGEPIEGVKVTVLNHDSETSFVTTHSVGDFHRPIKGGTYTFEFSKDGFCTEKTNVTVSDGQREDVDVFLFPEGNCPVTMECYEQVSPSAAGSYVMGYLNGSTLLMPTHNGSSTANATSVDVTPTENGFSVEEETLTGLYTLTAYGNGQYYISYNGRYLAKTNYGSSLTWGTSTSQYGRWHIDNNGIYVTSSSGMGGSSTYYLFFDTNSNSFKLSTTQHNNITFYQEGDCPTTVALNDEWNWWTPTIEMSLEDLETALGGNAILINSQDEGFARYDGEGWSGTLTEIEPGQMYRVLTTAATEFTLNGAAVTSAITILPGYNWFGYTGSQSKTISAAFSGFTPTEDDTITAEDGTSATYTNGSWDDNFILMPGHGYVYHSNAQESRNITFE